MILTKKLNRLMMLRVTLKVTAEVQSELQQELSLKTDNISNIIKGEQRINPGLESLGFNFLKGELS
ncbi:MAG: hypothetical protein ACQEP9_08660 [Bacillota bacterium]